MTKDISLFKSYKLIHKTNYHKLDSLFQLYSVYSTQYKKLIHSHWLNFIHHRYHLISTSYYNSNVNKIIIPNFYAPFKFTHLGSTKHIDTQLNASYLQGCLQQVSSSLNKHLTSIEQLFNQFINKSSINNDNKDFLHQLRSINKNRAWLNKNTIYYPIITTNIVDDFGNEITITSKKETFVSQQALTLAKQIFKHITKHRIQFPSVKSPKLVLDTRTCEIQLNKQSKVFDYWLNISTLEKGKKVIIPIQSNSYFNNAIGMIGNTVELNFISSDYKIKQHKHNSLSSHNKKKQKVIYSNKQLNITLNKKYTLAQQQVNLNIEHDDNKSHVVGFDLGLSTFIATSDGNDYGKHWLATLSRYDKKSRS